MRPNEITKANIGDFAVVTSFGFHVVPIKTVSDYRIGYGERRSFSKQDILFVSTSPDDCRQRAKLLNELREIDSRRAAAAQLKYKDAQHYIILTGQAPPMENT